MNFFHLFLAVLLSQVGVCLHQQCAAVFVTKPTGDGGNICAVFNASRGEKIAEAMRGEIGKAKFAAGGVKAFFRVGNPGNVIRWRGSVVALEPQKQFAQLTGQWNLPCLVIFGAVRASRDIQKVLFKVNVLPC